MSKIENFIKENSTLFPSTFHEDFLAKKHLGNAPKWLEDVGIKPHSVLGEGSFKTYHYERAASWSRPSLSSSNSASGLGPAPLPGPIPLR